MRITYHVSAVAHGHLHFAAFSRFVVVVVVVAAAADSGAVVTSRPDDVGEDDVDANVRASVGGDHRREATPVSLFQVDLEKSKSALLSELHPFSLYTSELHPPVKLICYMSERGPASHGGLHAVLEVRCRRPASDGLSEGRVPSSGHRGVDRQDNKNQPKKRKKRS